MASTQRPVLVTVISDIACPWCWVGKRSFEVAAEQSGMPVELRWKPFQLSPDLPATGADKLAFYQKKFGEQRVKQILLSANNPLNARGKPLGLEFVYHEGSRVFNTRDCHRLLFFAGTVSAALQNELKERLLRGYHKDGLDFSDRAVLSSTAESAGLPKESVAAILAPNSTLYHAEVDRELRESHSVATGVPHFIFPNGREVSGGESPEVFAAILREQPR